MPIFDDTRADWNARPPLEDRTRVPWSERIGVSWHWIGPGRGPSASGSHQKCLDQVRDWQEQHQRKGWKDIGYNALVCQHARAIEGRGLTYSGSHSPGVNYSHVGIQFMVGEDTPGGTTPAMFARAVRLRADIGALGKNIRRDWRHRDDPAASTECCGPHNGAWVRSGGPTATNTTTPVQEDDMPSTAEVAEATATETLTREVVDTGGTKRTVGWAIGAILRDGQRQSLQLAALSAAVESLASSKGVDPAAIAAEVGSAVRDRLAQIRVTDGEG